MGFYQEAQVNTRRGLVINLLRADSAKWKKVIRESNIALE